MAVGTAAAARAPAPPETASLARLLLARLEDSGDRRAVCDALDGGRTWTWSELIAAAVKLADRLEAAGAVRSDRLAHVGPHTPDWIVVDLACLLAGFVHAPLHDDATAAERAAWLRWLTPRFVLHSGPGPWPSGAPERAGTIDLRSAVGPGQAGCGTAVLGSDAWRDLWADRGLLRSRVRQLAAACDPEACATIVLSSGTTGHPHGVMHCQRALAANAIASADVFLDHPEDVRLCWLPLSHLLARTGDLATAIVRGSCLNVVTDRRRLLDACRVLPPTVVLGVPAFFERLERGVESAAIPDLAAALGGRVRVCVSGGAPLRSRTAACFAARGIPLVEGYGLAEAGPVVTLANPRSARVGTVGPPLAGVELRIDDRPDTRGQLLVRTPCRAVGLLTDDGSARPEDVDDWLETGDLAAIDADGHVRITGRLCDTLVLSGGTKLPPAEVEAALAEDPVVAQVCVAGSGLAVPVALVVPDPAALRAAVRRMGIVAFSRRAVLRHPRVLAWLGRRLERRQRHLPRSWRARRAVLVGRPFTADRGEATASFKLKRPEIAAHFAAELAAAAAPEPPSWVARVACGTGAREPQPPVVAAERSSWAAPSLWQGGRRDAVDADGFALAATRAAAPLRDAVAAVVDRAIGALVRLRADGCLYDPIPPAADSPPLDDAPAPPAGRFSRAAEEAVGEAGLWGLLVPERFGGTGCSLQELTRAVTRCAAEVPTAAGMLAVHSSIGAVAAVTAFGSPSQQERHLPGLARGRPLSIFGATEPDAGCDLHAISARLERRDGRLLLTGTKMFITGATHGRLVKLLALLDGRPTVALVRLPAADTPEFRLRHYGLHPLKHAHNAALEFTRFVVDEADILQPPEHASDGMRIVWHGLNRGRVTLAAQAAGTLRLLLAGARDHALRRRTWGEPIASRELVQGRLGRIASGIVACDSLAGWAAAAIDVGQSGELEAITAKIVASQCVREAAIDALGVHGGPAFLVGHPLGDSFHDHFAVTVYEGESDLLGLALFKGLCKHHPLAGRSRDSSGMSRAAAWLAWRIGQWGRRPHRDDIRILDRRLRHHAAAARRQLDRSAIRIDRGIRRHGRPLADRQLLIGGWSADVRDLMSVLAVAHHADVTGDDGDLRAADCWCRLALARAGGRRLTAADHAALAALGRQVVERGVPAG
jgi:long-subunit acyl-CoA synthetase (AMP-forming)/alkylation response protein AidB-like acyl-CoA dehydrogenase